MQQPQGSASVAALKGAAIIARIVVGFVAGILLAGAYFADATWLIWHFPSDFHLSFHALATTSALIRVAMGTSAAVLLAFMRPIAQRLIILGQTRAAVLGVIQITLAIALAIVASELVLRSVPRRVVEYIRTETEPLRMRDMRLGWILQPARTGYRIQGGRTIEYAFDSAGYRARKKGGAIDFDKPTIIFAGESIIGGYGLDWDESIPARVSSSLKIQSANIAVNGYASDQIYLRIKNELPRFRRPAAIVSIFTPMLFLRNLDDDRPHLGPDLIWHPAVKRWRLATLARRLVPYRNAGEVRRGIDNTRQILRATVSLAHVRGAKAVIVVPQFIPESPAERLVRKQVLEGSGLPYVYVKLDPAWRIPGDWHPDARAARAMAAAITARLQERTNEPAR